jgi:hypothetical protein
MVNGYTLEAGVAGRATEYLKRSVQSTQHRNVLVGSSSGASTQAIFLPALTAISLKLVDLLTWPEGWNGYDALAPNPAAVEHALWWIREMHNDALATGEGWSDPHINADAEGNVVFEWWEDQHKLTIYVLPETVEYVKVWGPRMFADMEDGEVADSEVRQALWRWLTG